MVNWTGRMQAQSARDSFPTYASLRLLTDQGALSWATSVALTVPDGRSAPPAATGVLERLFAQHGGNHG